VSVVAFPEQIAAVRELFLEYAESLSFSLCFQSFDKELAGLPGGYAAPDGRLLLAMFDGQPAGCVALHKIEDHVCEMKRLYAHNSAARAWAKLWPSGSSMKHAQSVTRSCGWTRWSL